MMIIFVNQKFPEIGIRTVLRAALADAETVEFHSNISRQMREADIEFFLENLAWTERDMMESGNIREPLLGTEDRYYIIQRYTDLFEIEKEEQTFELLTRIDVDEHKWYLSEQKQKEVTLYLMNSLTGQHLLYIWILCCINII
ncbi:MAG: hypothetical protein KJ963_06490 [Bacteroidetes bacterium]|nr:hypothetical protein [Bacteroidota bacterium]MBU2636716.1 hypothetical protein [Bacteroidota bacterium]